MNQLSALLGIILFLASANFARASLGEMDESVQKDALALASPSTTMQASHYKRHEMKNHGTRIQEFAGTNGKVFAMAWSGSNHPDLKTLLGIYYPEFQSSYAKAKQTHHHGGVILVESEHLHIEMGGTMKSLSGQIWLLQEIPNGVNPNEIQ